MLCANDFRVITVQAGVFTVAGADSFRTAAVLASVLKRFASRFDGEVQTSAQQQRFEVPTGSVAQFAMNFGGPSVALSSQDGRWKYESTPGRSDAFWFSKPDDETKLSVAEISADCIEPLFAYPVRSDSEVQVGRLALVVQRWLPIDNPATNLAECFFKPNLVDEDSERSPLRHSAEFRFDNLKKYQSPVENRQVNSWVRCLSHTVNGRTGILVEQDINTLQEEMTATAFRPEEIRQFFAWTPAEMDLILDKYFPQKT